MHTHVIVGRWANVTNTYGTSAGSIGAVVGTPPPSIAMLAPPGAGMSTEIALWYTPPAPGSGPGPPKAWKPSSVLPFPSHKLCMAVYVVVSLPPGWL
jgi:hypothetical protein